MLRIDTEAGTATAVLTTGEVPLREPTVDEWKQIRRAYLDGETKLREANGNTDVVYDDAVFAQAFCLVLQLLGNQADPDPGGLPVAATSIDPYVALRDLWASAVIVNGLPWSPGSPLRPPADPFTPVPEG